jgi:RNA-directed DNA polymerase
MSDQPKQSSAHSRGAFAAYLCNRARIEPEKLYHIADNASKFYKIYEIPKRSGGTRQIHHPSRQLKSLQRFVVRNLIRRLPVHSAATAYRLGSSIKKNTRFHQNSAFTIRIDLENFFPSFNSLGIFEFLKENRSLFNSIGDDQSLLLATQLVSRNGRLTIGAPSSPSITNAMMYSVDTEIALWCDSRELIYSRYADDMFISSSKTNALSEVPEFIRYVLSNYKYSKLLINDKKTAFLSRKYRRTITGLVITPQGKISIGLLRKIEIKKLIYKASKNELAAEERAKLAGLISYCYDVERQFYETLCRKYGAQLVRHIVGRNDKKKGS